MSQAWKCLGLSQTSRFASRSTHRSTTRRAKNTHHSMRQMRSVVVTKGYTIKDFMSWTALLVSCLNNEPKTLQLASSNRTNGCGAKMTNIYLHDPNGDFDFGFHRRNHHQQHHRHQRTSVRHPFPRLQVLVVRGQIRGGSWAEEGGGRRERKREKMRERGRGRKGEWETLKNWSLC